jgi:hypothetical protein
VDSTGTPGTGTKVKKQTFDDIHDAIDTAIYDPSLDEGPPEIAGEVVAGRAEYASLDARFKAVEAAAAGGAATSNLHQAGGNLVPNDSFLIWPNATANTAPAFWGVDAGLTSLVPITAQDDTNRFKFYGRNYVALTNPDLTARSLYCDLFSAANNDDDFGAVPVANAKIGAGCYVYSTTPDAIDVFVFDGVTEHQVGEQGSGTSQWIWSGAVGGDYNGGATLGASATQLTLRLKIKKATTVWVASPAGVFGNDSLTRWPGPTPFRRGTWVWGAGDDGQIATGVKAFWYPPNPCFIFNSRLRAGTGSGTTTFTIDKGATEIASLSITGGGTDSGDVAPSNIRNASLGRADKLTLECTAVDAAMRGPMVNIDYLEYQNPLEAALGGYKTITVS